MAKCDFMTKRLNTPTAEVPATDFMGIHDNVNNPSHYQGNYGMESIDVLRNFMTPEQLRGFHLGNALKYQLRYQKENGLEDLKKASKNLNWLIELEEISDDQ